MPGVQKQENRAGESDTSAIWSQAVDARRKRLVQSVQMILALLVAIFLSRAIAWHIWPRIASLSMAAIVLAVSFVLLSKNYRLLATHLLVVCMAVVMAVAVMTSGGIYTVVTGWLPLLPAVAGFFLGVRVALYWTVFVVLAAVMLFVGEAQGIFWPDLTPLEFRLGQERAHILAQLFLMSGLVTIFLRELTLFDAEIGQQMKRLESEIKERYLAEQLAIAADRSKTQFLANMSHQLRTPLNAIIGFSSHLCRKKRGDNAELEAFDAITRNGKFLLGVINELLDLAEVERDDFTRMSKTIDVSALVDELVASKIYGTQECPRVVIRERVLAFVYVNHDRLYQALHAILTYLIDVDAATDIVVVTRLCQNESTVAIDMTLLSSPLSASDMIDVFSLVSDRLLTVDSEMPVSTLGLVIAERIVALHQGSIAVIDSDQGLIVSIYLPIVTS